MSTGPTIGLPHRCIVDRANKLIRVTLPSCGYYGTIAIITGIIKFNIENCIEIKMWSSFLAD